MSRFGFVRLLLLLSPVLFMLFYADAHPAVAEASDCKKYVIIFARGSGQKIDESQPEMTAMRSSLSKYIEVNDSNFIQLDATDMPNSEGLKYEPVAVAGSFRETATGFTAMVSRGNLGAYPKSVMNGKELLVNYIKNSNYLKCGTRIVLTGYSQGAHVITDSLFDSRIRNYLPQISFVATFGDPSLDLDTILGGDMFGKTPWYRGSALKYISGGVVNVRNPYLPNEVKDKTGAWCHADDMICTGSILKLLNEGVNHPHSLYPLKAIPDAAREIAARLREDLKQPFTGPACGALKQDIVLAVNVSPSVMSDTVFLGEKGIKKIVDGLSQSACDVRVGMVTFGRKGKEATQPEFDFNQGSIGEVLAAHSHGDKNYTVEKADVAGAIDTALDFNFRDDAQKMVFVLSDAPGDNYKSARGEPIRYDDLISQPIMQQIIRKSREKGGVEIHAGKITHPFWVPYAYTPGTVQFYDYMSQLVDLTAGTYRDSERCGSDCSWLDMRMTFEPIQAHKPVVSVPNVRLKVGESVNLTARDVSGGVIPNALGKGHPMSYQWYLDCANLDKLSKLGETVTFAPDKPGACTGAVQLREDSGVYCSYGCREPDPYGMRAVTPFTIEVLPADYTPPPLPGLVRNIKKNHIWSENTVRITWDPPANAATVGELAYVVKDSDGTVLGVTSSPQIDITEVPASDDPIVLVSAASAGGMGGGTSSSDAADISAPQPTPDPGNVLGDSTSKDTDLQRLLGNAQLVSTPSDDSPAVRFKQVTSNAQSPVSFAYSVENSANMLSQGLIHHMNSAVNAPTWLKLTIMAIPVVTALALGMVIKYTLKLRAR